MTIGLIILCVISGAINLLLVWYARRLVGQLVLFLESIDQLQEHFDSFDEHVREIHELEMFYGDETLGGLMKHSKDILEKVQDFRASFSWDAPPKEEFLDDPE